EQAAARLAAALTQTLCAGVHTNERWLRRILRSTRFLEVRHDVALLDQAAEEFAGPPAAAPEALILAALALHAGAGGAAARDPGAGSPWDLADGFTPNLPARVAYGFSWHGRTHADARVLGERRRRHPHHAPAGRGGVGAGRRGTEGRRRGGADGDRSDENGAHHHRPVRGHRRDDSLRPRRSRARGERAAGALERARGFLSYLCFAPVPAA